MGYEIRGEYPSYTLWKDGVEDTRFACNTLEQAHALMLEVETIYYLDKFIPLQETNLKYLSRCTRVCGTATGAFVYINNARVVSVHNNQIVLTTNGQLCSELIARINAIGVAFAKDFEPWCIRNGELYISNRGMAYNVHTQVYQLKEN